MDSHEYRWSSPDATEAAGAALGQCLRPGDLVGLVGDLGAGKTLLVQGIARGLGVPADTRVTSPTFTLVNEYAGGAVPLAHADLYRLERARELDELGLDELCRSGIHAVVVEWSDRFAVLAPDHLEVRLEVVGEEERAVTMAAGGRRSAELLAAWEARLAR